MIEKISKKVQDFYNTTPFPDYSLERFNTKEDLILDAQGFAKILNRSIPEDATIIDVGTGTGQLSAYLSIKRKCVFGIDFSDSSLNKAKKLKEKLKLDSWKLLKVNILNEKEIENMKIKFDYVLCLGVLHHTGDVYKGFKNVLKLVKPGGYIVIGLYNKYGRILLKLRKILIKTIFKNNKKIKDMFIKMQIKDIKDNERLKGWWNDQYMHPYEKSHTIGEVLKWFKKNNIEYYQTIPSLASFNKSNLEIIGVWNKEIYPYLPIRIYNQITWLWKTHREGGYWLTFGKLNNKI